MGDAPTDPAMPDVDGHIAELLSLHRDHGRMDFLVSKTVQMIAPAGASIATMHRLRQWVCALVEVDRIIRAEGTDE